MMNVYDQSLKSLVEALTSWLHFEVQCGREVAFEEKYLVGPIIQCLLPRFGDRVRSSVPHPVLPKKERVDFAVLATGGDHWEVAIETKWLDDQSPRSEKSLTRIVKDILRLEMISRCCDCKHSWLVVAGKTSTFSDMWYVNRGRNISSRRKDVAQAFMPSRKKRIGLSPTVQYHGNPEPKDWKLMREFIAKACDLSKDGGGFDTVEVGKAFDISPEKPFPKLSIDDADQFPYRLPPHDFAVFGWNVGQASNTFIPIDEFCC